MSQFVKVKTQGTAYTKGETKLVNFSLVTTVERFGTGSRLWLLQGGSIDVEQAVEEFYSTLAAGCVNQ
jgi:hypothetical protein